MAKTANSSDSGDLPRALGQPATRALATIGITRLDQVAGRKASELLALHGFGPKGIAVLRAALKERGQDLA